MRLVTNTKKRFRVPHMENVITLQSYSALHKVLDRLHPMRRPFQTLIQLGLLLMAIYTGALVGMALEIKRYLIVSHTWMVTLMLFLARGEGEMTPVRREVSNSALAVLAASMDTGGMVMIREKMPVVGQATANNGIVTISDLPLVCLLNGYVQI